MTHHKDKGKVFKKDDNKEEKEEEEEEEREEINLSDDFEGEGESEFGGKEIVEVMSEEDSNMSLSESENSE